MEAKLWQSTQSRGALEGVGASYVMACPKSGLGSLEQQQIVK